MIQFIRRFILSLYYHGKKYERRRFFDAWWQFTFLISYVLIGFFAAILNVLFGLGFLQFDHRYYYVGGALPLIFDFLFEKPLRRKYEQRLVDQIDDLKPIPRWGLYMALALALAVLMYSFTWIPKINLASY